MTVTNTTVEHEMDGISENPDLPVMRDFQLAGVLHFGWNLTIKIPNHIFQPTQFLQRFTGWEHTLLIPTHALRELLG